MTVESMNDLFLETLKDIYYAEKHILKSLPAMIKKANGGELKDALETHRKETEGQIQRLEEVFMLVDSAPRGKKCEAIEGILAEAKEHMAEIRTAPHSTKLEPGVAVVLAPTGPGPTCVMALFSLV